MTAQIAIEAADFAVLHTHAANRGEVLQVRFLHLCREVAGTAAATPAVAAEEPASQPHLYPHPPRYPRPADGRLCGTAPEPELALGYELPPPPPPAGAHGILARAAKLNQTQV